MPRVNHTIDDRSPLIRYLPAGAWRLGSRTQDPLGMRYDNNGTFTLTTEVGASASFTFNGTGIWILGAKRSNHGPYDVNLDNARHPGDGFSQEALFQVPLFAAMNLFNGLHTVQITNQPNQRDRPFIDIDSIIWETEVEEEDLSQPQRVIAHTDNSFRFEPPAAWSTLVSAGFNSTTGRLTSTTGASATLNFTGSTISVFGAVNNNLGSYSVQLDDRPPETFNATVLEYVPQTILYQSDNLGPGLHTVKFVNQPERSGLGLLLDYALITGESTTQAVAESGATGLGTGAVAGIAVAAVALLAAIPLLWFFWWRKRHVRRRVDVNLMEEDKNNYPDHQEIAPVSVTTPFTTTSAPSMAMSNPYLAPSTRGGDSETTSFYQPTEISSSSASNSTRALYVANSTDAGGSSYYPSQSEAGSSYAYPREKAGFSHMSPTKEAPQGQPSVQYHLIDDAGQVEVDAPPAYDHPAPPKQP
ncbi:hypothetical protein ONZ45_g4244 [Pleurotus djamor]|nr:hypothetical protein ONZ45_g4244 [Pleurotus djamor]